MGMYPFKITNYSNKRELKDEPDFCYSDIIHSIRIPYFLY